MVYCTMCVDVDRYRGGLQGAATDVDSDAAVTREPYCEGNQRLHHHMSRPRGIL